MQKGHAKNISTMIYTWRRRRIYQKFSRGDRELYSAEFIFSNISPTHSDDIKETYIALYLEYKWR